jgi:prolyl-tRNA synthetase
MCIRDSAKALDLTVLDSDGKPNVVTMGSYGIGVSRAVAAIAEQSHDQLGLRWPREISPADIHIVATGKEDLPFDTAFELAQKLEAAGLRVMLDDRRDASPGVKFKDAELIGIPTIVIVGKGLANGVIEVRDRWVGTSSEISLEGAETQLLKMVGK